MAPEDVHKTALVTPDGQYEFTRIPFGMVNSGATLVRGFRKIIEGMPGVRSYIDDIVIISYSWEDHFRTLKELFDRLRKARSHDNLEKVQNTPCPTTKKQVRSFWVL